MLNNIALICFIRCYIGMRCYIGIAMLRAQLSRRGQLPALKLEPGSLQPNEILFLAFLCSSSRVIAFKCWVLGLIMPCAPMRANTYACTVFLRKITSLQWFSVNKHHVPRVCFQSMLYASLKYTWIELPKCMNSQCTHKDCL